MNNLEVDNLRLAMEKLIKENYDLKCKLAQSWTEVKVKRIQDGHDVVCQQLADMYKTNHKLRDEVDRLRIDPVQLKYCDEEVNWLRKSNIRLGNEVKELTMDVAALRSSPPLMMNVDMPCNYRDSEVASLRRDIQNMGDQERYLLNSKADLEVALNKNRSIVKEQGAELNELKGRLTMAKNAVWLKEVDKLNRFINQLKETNHIQSDKLVDLNKKLDHKIQAIINYRENSAKDVRDICNLKSKLHHLEHPVYTERTDLKQLLDKSYTRIAKCKQVSSKRWHEIINLQREKQELTENLRSMTAANLTLRSHWDVDKELIKQMNEKTDELTDELMIADEHNNDMRSFIDRRPLPSACWDRLHQGTCAPSVKWGKIQNCTATEVRDAEKVASKVFSELNEKMLEPLVDKMIGLLGGYENQPTKMMTNKSPALSTSYEEWRRAGWSDEQLVQGGRMYTWPDALKMVCKDRNHYKYLLGDLFSVAEEKLVDHGHGCTYYFAELYPKLNKEIKKALK